ncbi:histidine transporter [Aminobacter sp. Y103A]|jgi:nucleoside recognition membrane protein YjiH|uniref:Histidine transporter n=1 Tax=Aminobacter aminovorans TaxID=83263 RepID=A0AAC8YRE6_AMIAI|nr:MULTISPECIES: YjiH family protein [Aminobacter]AMS43072.1 histidine transporter [Aminobacter aminovorans]MBB3708505.1 nucleoside recognition membrane protein YjiH [Aminobacter aminovorans]WMC99102.1 YjiH family protein [Aminobacter aminovorans]BBD37397.1 histidine transporter [Aminobacter sp. SS-2016]
MTDITSHEGGSRAGAGLKLVLFSLIGIVFFFVPVTIGTKSTILLDHAATALAVQLRPVAVAFVCLLIAYGAIGPFVRGSWNRNVTEAIFSALRVLGLGLSVMYLTGVGPETFFAPDMLPFLFDKLVLSVGLIVPIGALALAFLVGYGLLEFTGVLVQPVMRPVWRTPGWSAIDAVASFVGSYSLALLITDRVFKEGKYTVREAVIIATGFSTVSATFMIIVAKTLGLMGNWNLYFWTTFVVTFVVSAITARIWPISGKDHPANRDQPLAAGKSRLQTAIDVGLDQAQAAPPLHALLRDTFIDGLRMASIILPSIMAVGLLGLLAAKYTPIFDILGLALYPFTWLAQFNDPMLAAKSLASGLAEMFLPAILLKEADLGLRFVAAVVSVSQVLFLSASIPCVLATSIPLSFRDLIIIWYIRTALSILVTAPIAWLAISMGWLA